MFWVSFDVVSWLPFIPSTCVCLLNQDYLYPMVQNTASSTDESRPDREEGMSMSEIGITMLKWLRSFPLVVVVEELVARVVG